MERPPIVPYASRGSILGDCEARVLTQLVASGSPLSAGVHRERFEQRFARHIGVRHALSVTSGTIALELAIYLLDLQPGDEVIVTPQTFQATVQPLLGLPATVRFCDVDPDSLNMDPAVLAPLITDRTRAVILVHYGGWSADMDKILALTRNRSITVIEDCAHALGSQYGHRRPGSMGDIGCFSFHSSKNITTLGEGGMITLDRDDWAARLERLRSNEVDGYFVRMPGPNADVPKLLPWMRYASSAYGFECRGIRRPGTNATLSEAAAAVGVAQLERLDELVARRRWIARRLDEVVRAHALARVPQPGPGVEHAHHLYTFFTDGTPGLRESVVHALDQAGVEVQLRYFPLHLLPEWRERGHRPGECPVAEKLWFAHHVNLPCQPGLTDEQVDYMAAALDEALHANRKSCSPQPLRRAGLRGAASMSTPAAR